MRFADQEERERAVKAFRERRKDVLVATDVASKGLDFQGIKHVINYDMPDDIENYGMFVFKYKEMVHVGFFSTTIIGFCRYLLHNRSCCVIIKVVLLIKY